MRKFFKKYRKKLTMVVVGLILLYVSVDLTLTELNKPMVVSYKTFEKDLKNDKIDTVYYNVNSEYMRYTLKTKKSMSLSEEESQDYTEKDKSKWRMTYYPADQNFRKDLLKKGVKVKIASFEATSMVILTGVLPLSVGVYFIVALLMMLRRSTNPTGSKDDLIQTSKVKFSDVVGHDEIIEDIRFIVSLLRNPTLGKDLGIKIPRGILFTGEPGTGKTLLAKAIAGEAEVPFIYINASSFVEMYVGLGAKRVRDAFKLARKHKPCIVFIDEIDAVGGSRGDSSSHSEQTQTLNALLQELDGFSTESGIVVIGATNTPEKLDKALVRAGRFDRKVVISPPKDWNARKAIFEHYLRNKPVSNSVDIDAVSKQVSGFTGADIESLVNEACLVCALRGGIELEKQDFEEAIDKVVFNGNRSKDQSKDMDRKIIAYHEAGHAVMSYLCGIPIARASIIGTTSGVGGAVFQEDVDSQFLTDEDFIKRIKISYGGRASEYIIFGKVTTGASNDITQATRLIQSYVQRYGFDKDFGLLDMGVLDRYIDTNEIVSKYSEISIKLYNDTVDTLLSNKKLIIALAEDLLINETLSGDYIENLFNSLRSTK